MMQVIKPTAVQNSMIVSSTAVETVATYAAGTTYAKGTRVRYNLFIWESLVAANLGNTPDISPTFWILVGADNTHAMFDGQISNKTTGTASLAVKVAIGDSTNSMAFLGLVGSTLRVVGTDGPSGPTIYDNSYDLDGTVIVDWYGYFFEPFVQLDTVVITDFPAYSFANITATLTATAAVAIGEWQLGTIYSLGRVEYGATAGIIDYSKKTKDNYGNATFVVGEFSKRMTVNMFLDNTDLFKLQTVLAGLRATPCVWIGTDDPIFTPLVVYGFYKDFTLNVAYPTQSYCSLDIEGLI
jgi:hypothetical protein